MTRILILAACIALLATTFPLPGAGDVTGTWKRTKMTLVDGGGKTTDMMQMMEKTMPCSKDIRYTFMRDGHMKTNVPDACGAMKKTIESMNADGQWKSNGQTVTITTTMKGFPPATYDVTIQGNTMTWVFDYADNPKTPNPTKAKRMTITYQKL